MVKAEKKPQKGKVYRKEGTNAALALSQHSTAPMGKFDVQRIGEKAMKLFGGQEERRGRGGSRPRGSEGGGALVDWGQ